MSKEMRLCTISHSICINTLVNRSEVMYNNKNYSNERKQYPENVFKYHSVLNNNRLLSQLTF